MKINPEELTKRYYTIGEVAGMFDESTSLLRYWETIFRELKPRKDKGGIRRYTSKDISLINDIYQLVKKKGYTLEGAKEGLKKFKNLRKIKTELTGIRKDLEKLKTRINPGE
ncbi:MAG: MerR family transcriptional regulator [Saprospiraceae bacterium]|nr:MerR family transcriptional regulator [Bacteroidia bacterium]MBT8228638.1 MerR family transcriptional regulator [Bacteroidia bacterium]NNF21758.1 MerR family transcriptional regulator [Saprospiraceae bacterium]NNK90788.1 MerR family transcriptional regulator [Saprospiraceae bacterium]